MDPMPFPTLICFTRELICPIPCIATLYRELTFRSVPVFLRTTTAIARYVRMFAGSREAMGIFLHCVHFCFICTAMRATMGVHVVVRFNAFVLRKTNLFCEFRPVVDAFRIGTITDFVSWQPSGCNQVVLKAFMRPIYAIRINYRPDAIFNGENKAMTRAIEFGVNFVGRVRSMAIAGLVPMEVNEVV